MWLILHNVIAFYRTQYAACVLRTAGNIRSLLASPIRSHHFLSPAILISVNSAESVLTLILKQPVAYQRCLCCPLQA